MAGPGERQRQGPWRRGGGRVRGRQAAVRGQGRERLHGRHPARPTGPHEAAGPGRAPIRSAAAQGLQGSLGRRAQRRHVGPAGARDPGRARRLDARRRRPPGRLQGDRARARPEDRRSRNPGQHDQRGPCRQSEVPPMPESKTKSAAAGSPKAKTTSKSKKAAGSASGSAASPFHGATPEELAALDALGNEGVWKIDGQSSRSPTSTRRCSSRGRRTTPRSPSAS